MTFTQMSLLFGLMVIICTGCATVSNPVRESFGISHELAKRNQTLNPEASGNLQTGEGFNGGAAQRAMERYHKSFTEVPARQEFVLRAGELSR